MSLIFEAYDKGAFDAKGMKATLKVVLAEDYTKMKDSAENYKKMVYGAVSFVVGEYEGEDLSTKAKAALVEEITAAYTNKLRTDMVQKDNREKHRADKNSQVAENE